MGVALTSTVLLMVHLEGLAPTGKRTMIGSSTVTNAAINSSHKESRDTQINMFEVPMCGVCSL